MTQLLRKRLAAGVFVLAGALALAACGGGATGTPTPFSLGGGSRIQGFAPTPTAAIAPAEPTKSKPPQDGGNNGPTPPPPLPPSDGLQIGSVGNDLLFDTDMMMAAAGSEVKIILINKATSKALQHNWVLVAAGAADAVAAAALVAGPASDWIPKDDPNVLAYVPLTDGGDSSMVTFPAPPAGTYEYVCTFPGHAATMTGVFEVKG